MGYDEVWCVFDADPEKDNPGKIAQFNDAIRLALKNGINVAYSHQAFEYWLILHFNDHQWGEMDRKDYARCINEELKKYWLKYNWSGSKAIARDFFEFLDARVDTAISRAKKIYAWYCAKDWTRSNPWAEESSTTVFMLVEKIKTAQRGW